MKKTTWILAILYVLCNTSLMYTAPGDSKERKEQAFQIATCNHAYKSHSVPKGITDVKITINSSNHGTDEIHIPLSVKKIDLEGSLSNHAKLILYARHVPHISDTTSCSNHAQVQIMHPIRKYTYHLTALLMVEAALAYYFLCND